MKIPIFNSIYLNENKKLKTKKINYKILNDLNLSQPSQNKFPSLKILRKIKNKVSLFETILISANDELVNLYLNKNIKFNDIFINLHKILNSKFFKPYLYKKPTNVDQIIKLNKQVRLKTINLCIK